MKKFSITLFVILILTFHAKILVAQTLEKFQADAENAIALIEAQNFDEAAPITDKLLQQAKTDFAQDSDAAISLYNLGSAYRTANQYKEAADCLELTTSINERILGESSTDIADSLDMLGLIYYEWGNYPVAVRHLERSLAIREMELGKNHPDTATALSNVAFLYNAQNRFAEAEPLYKQALETRETVLGKDHLDTAMTLNSLAFMYYTQGRYAEAEPLYKRTLEIHEMVLGKDHTDTAMIMNNLAELYRTQSRFAEAEPLYKQALETRETVLGKDHPNTAMVLNNMAVLYHIQNRFAEAEPLYKRSLEIRETKLGKDHPQTIQSLINLTEFYRIQNRYTEAESFYKRVLETHETALGKDHPDTVQSLINLAVLYVEQDRYTEAEPFYKQALEIRETKLGKDHLDTAMVMNNLAVLYVKQGRYTEAEPFYQQSLDIRETKLGKDHPVTAQSLNNLALLYVEQGRYTEAEPFYKQALEIRETKLGKDHLDTAMTLDNLANFSRIQGHYFEAEQFYKRSLEIRETKLGKDHPDTAQSLNNLALSYHYQSRFVEAETLYKRSLEIRETKLGKDHLDTAQSLNNLGGVYYTQDRYSEAEPFYQQSLDIRETKLGKDHPDTSQSLNNLAALYDKQSRFAEAEPLYERALEIRETKLGKDHIDTAQSLNNLAKLYFNQGRYTEAELFFDRAIAIYKINPIAANMGQRWYSNRSSLYHATERPAEAVSDLKCAMDLSLQVRKNVSGTDEERAKTFEQYYYLFETMVDWQNEFSQNNEKNFDVNEVYEAMEFSRGRGLQDLIDMQGLDLLKDVDEDLAKKLRNEEQEARTDVKSVGQQLAILPQRNGMNEAEKKKETEELETKLTAAHQRLVNAEAAIRNASKIYRDCVGKDRKPVPFVDVKKQLETDQSLALEYLIGNEVSYLLVYGFQQKPALFPLQINEDQVELFDVEAGPLTAQKLNIIFQNDQLTGLQDIHNNAERGTGILQLIIQPSLAYGKVKAIVEKDNPTLGPDEIDKKTLEKMPEYSGQFSRLYDHPLHAKLAALWPVLVPDETLRAKITSKDESPKQLLILPDGSLARFPFEMLVVNDNADEPSYLLDQKPTTLYAPSMSFYYNLTRRPIPVEKKALTVGNPDYIATEKKPADSTPEARPEKISVQSALPLQSYRPQSIIPTRGEYIEPRFGQLAPLKFSADETFSVMKSCTSFQIPVQRFNAKESTEKNVRENVRGCTLVHLACHGIAFEEYGNMFGCLALTVGDKDDSNDDGFLELREIFALDLKSCELAILSACDTNLGTNQQGEGTWSLSRGVLVAGSRRVVTSNWKVSDEITADLVREFVKQTNPATIQDYAAALRSAQLKVKSDRIETAHPYYWAAFILVGGK